MIQFRIVLLELRPNVWRRVQLPNCLLSDLPETIRQAFQWPQSPSEDWECVINGQRVGSVQNNGESVSLRWDQNLHTALCLNGDSPVGKCRIIYRGNWTHLLVFESLDSCIDLSAMCLGGEGINNVSLQSSPDIARSEHRQIASRNAAVEAARLLCQINAPESTSRGSRSWEIQWCRWRGEDEWADQLEAKVEREHAHLQRRLEAMKSLMTPTDRKEFVASGGRLLRSAPDRSSTAPTFPFAVELTRGKDL